MLLLLFGPAMAAAMVMGAVTGRRDAGGGLLRPRGYEDIDPKTDMCEFGFHMSAVLDDRLWIHGGYVGYDNGTKSGAPNTYLREINLDKKFKVASRDEAPVKFLPQQDEVPEISQGVLWGYGNSLLEIKGYSERADTSFPDWNVPPNNTMWQYDVESAVWSSKTLSSRVKTTFYPLDVNVPSLGKGYYLADGAMSTYTWADGTWTNASTPWHERDWGNMVHLPIGERGLLVTIGGRTTGGSTPDGDLMSDIDIFNLNQAGVQKASPEGAWASTQIATAANSTNGIPDPRASACVWSVGAPDNTTYQIFMYGGVRLKGGYRAYRDLWVLSIPSFQWILIDDGKVGPRMPDTTHPLEREAHTCNLIGNSMMIMFGGYELPQFSRTCETTGIYAYDLNKLSWVETFDPDVAAQQYNVSQAVYSVIGGNALGSGSSTTIARINDPSLQSAFEEHIATAVKTPEVSPSEPGGTSGSGGGSNSGAIAGIVCGAVAVAAIITVILLFRENSDIAPAQGAPDIVPAQETPGIPPSTQSPPQPQPSARTLRIRDIPLSVTEEKFRDYLKDMLGYDDFVLSFVSGEHKITAAVTLTSGEPAVLSTCAPGNTIDLPYPDAELGLSVDCDFLGMTPLYSAKEPTVDIVAVTGLAGHAYGSWKSPNQSHMWLRDFLPSDLRDQGCEVRIITFGYDTALGDKTATPTIRIFARTLLENLCHTRTEENALRRPIIFIGHSIGGLVIKQALADASRPESRESDKAVLNSCVGLFFFGVPNRGLDIKNLRTLVNDQKNADFINSLGEGSELLKFIYDYFLRAVEGELKGCQIVSFFETRDTRAVELCPDGSWAKSDEMIRLVTQESATFALPTEAMHQQIAIDADHSKMVKFTNRYDQSYKIVEGRLSECVKEAPNIIEARLASVVMRR